MHLPSKLCKSSPRHPSGTFSTGDKSHWRSISHLKSLTKVSNKDFIRHFVKRSFEDSSIVRQSHKRSISHLKSLNNFSNRHFIRQFTSLKTVHFRENRHFIRQFISLKTVHFREKTLRRTNEMSGYGGGYPGQQVSFINFMSFINFLDFMGFIYFM